MSAQLNGIGFERISALDGSKDPPTTKGLTRFELACLESHKLAWREFLGEPAEHACFLEDDLHIRRGLAALVGNAAWIPADAHCVKLDTYLQKVGLGNREPAIGSREVARLYTRHQSSAAYMLSREGAFVIWNCRRTRACRRTTRFFPKTRVAPGLSSISSSPPSLSKTICRRRRRRPAFATAIAGARGEAPRRKRSPILRRLAREGVRILGQFPDFMELAYQKAFLRVETTIVGVQ